MGKFQLYHCSCFEELDLENASKLSLGMGITSVSVISETRDFHFILAGREEREANISLWREFLQISLQISDKNILGFGK